MEVTLPNYTGEKMKILVNVFHPDLDSSSINATWVETLRKSEDVTLNLEYSNYPNWELNIEREQQLMSEHQLIIFQFPLMWYSVPPLMKKWIDEVLAHGWAYGTDGDRLKGKLGTVAVSTGCSAESYEIGNENSFPMNEFLKPLQATFKYTQMKYATPFIFNNAWEASQREIDQSAEDYLAHILAI